MVTFRRPDPEECNSYFQTYIQKVEGENYLQTLIDAGDSAVEMMKNLPPEKWYYRYEEGKWNISEVFLHIIDTERIFAYRALRIARNDKTPLAGFEQDNYIPYLGVESRPPSSIIAEYEAVRNSTIQLFKYFDDSMLSRVGISSNNAITPRAIGFILAGHEIHHLQIIKERYLSQ